MKGLRSIALGACILIAAGYARGKDVGSDLGMGMLPSQLTQEELAVPVNVELVLGIFQLDLLKRQSTEATMSMLDVKGSYGEIVAWLKRSGLTVRESDPSCVVIGVQGTRQQLASVLHTDFVRELEAGRPVIVPVTGNSLPYRPMGSALTIEEMIVDVPASLPTPNPGADSGVASGPSQLLLEPQAGM